MRATSEDHPLLDYLRKYARVKNDAALARLLGVKPPMLSKMRHRTLSVTPAFILRVHEEFDIPVAQIRKVMDGC